MKNEEENDKKKNKHKSKIMKTNISRKSLANKKKPETENDCDLDSEGLKSQKQPLIDKLNSNCITCNLQPKSCQCIQEADQQLGICNTSF
jgi:hypothetical protein